MIKRTLITALSALMLVCAGATPVCAEEAGTAGVAPTTGMTYYGSGGRTSTLSRKIPTAIGVYVKSGTVPNVRKKSGSYGGTKYQALEVLPTGESGTFIQVDQAYSSSDKTPKMINNFYDHTLTAGNNYYWAGAINASFFNNTSSSSEYGAPIGAVIQGGIQAFKPYNDNWQGKAIYGSGYTTAFWNKDGMMKLNYEGWRSGKYYRYNGDTSPVTWDDGQTWSYTEGVSGAYSLYTDGVRTNVGLGDSIYRSGTYTATTLFGQKSDGTYVLLVDNSNLTVDQQAALMHDQLGCVNVIRMDGGGSSQMAYNRSLALSSFSASYNGSTDFVDSAPDLSQVRLSVTMDSGSTYSDIAIADTGAKASIVDSSGSAVDWSTAPLGTYYIRVSYMDMPVQSITIRKGAHITVTDPISGTSPIDSTYYAPVTVRIMNTDGSVASSDTLSASKTYTLSDSADIASWSVATASESSGAVTITATPSAAQTKTVRISIVDTDTANPQNLSSYGYSVSVSSKASADVSAQSADVKAKLEALNYEFIDTLPESLTYASEDVTVRVAHKRTVVDSTSSTDTFTRTIRYLDQSSNALADPTVQTLTRTTITEGSTTDLVTGVKTVTTAASTSWEPASVFPAVSAPEIIGYTPDISDIAEAEPESTSAEVTITYSASSTEETNLQYLESDASGAVSGSISVSADTTDGTWTSASDGSAHANGTYIVQIPTAVAWSGMNIGSANASAQYEVRVIGGLAPNAVVTVSAEAPSALSDATGNASNLTLALEHSRTTWSADDAVGDITDAGISGTAGTDTVTISGYTRTAGVFSGQITYTSSIAND